MVSRTQQDPHHISRSSSLLRAWRHLLFEAGSAPAGVASRALTAWRRTLTGAGSAAGRRMPSSSGLKTVGRALLRPGMLSDATDGQRRVLGIGGIAAVLVGAVGASAIGIVTDTPAATLLPAFGWALFWAAVRGVILAIMAPSRLRERSGLFAVWGTGSLPLALSLTPTLALVTFAVSAVQTWRACRGIGISGRESSVMVGAAFGVQVLVEIASWTLRAGTLLFLAGLGA